MYCWISYESVPLHLIEKDFRMFVERMKFFGQTSAASLLEPLWQMVLNFMGFAESNPRVLTGTAMNLEASMAFAEEFNPEAIVWIDFCTMILEYCFGDFDAAEKRSHSCIKIVSKPSGGMDAAAFVFFSCMTLLAKARKGGKRRRILVVRRRMRKLRKWAMHAPSNFNGKLLLLEAEIAGACGEHLLALSKYRSAILDLRDAGFLMEEAISNERLSKYLLERGDSTSRSLADQYAEEAIRLYTKWGASGKVAQLKNELHFVER